MFEVRRIVNEWQPDVPGCLPIYMSYIDQAFYGRRDSEREAREFRDELQKKDPESIYYVC
jgi:hypothetical protein